MAHIANTIYAGTILFFWEFWGRSKKYVTTEALCFCMYEFQVTTERYVRNGQTLKQRKFDTKIYDGISLYFFMCGYQIFRF